MKEDGVWRTIAGRRIFIKKGQSLRDAMKKSGKFNLKKMETVSSIKQRTLDRINKAKEKHYHGKYGKNNLYDDGVKEAVKKAQIENDKELPGLQKSYKYYGYGDKIKKYKGNATIKKETYKDRQKRGADKVIKAIYGDDIDTYMKRMNATKKKVRNNKKTK